MTAGPPDPSTALRAGRLTAFASPTARERWRFALALFAVALAILSALRALRGDGTTASRVFIDATLSKRLRAEAQRAGRRRQKAHDNFQERGFSDPVPAHEADAGSRRNHHPRIPEGMALAVKLIDATDVQRGFVHPVFVTPGWGFRS